MSLTRSLVLGFVLAAGTATEALADYNGVYGNTVVASLPNGASSQLHLRSDGTYDTVLPDGSTTSGTFTTANNQLCATQQSPTPPSSLTGPQCIPSLDGMQPGSTLTYTDPQSGLTITLTIVAGT